MPSIIDEMGLEVQPEAALVLTPEQISRTRDLIIIRLRKFYKVRFDQIAKIMNVSVRTAERRYHDATREVRDHYGSIELD